MVCIGKGRIKEGLGKEGKKVRRQISGRYRRQRAGEERRIWGRRKVGLSKG